MKKSEKKTKLILVVSVKLFIVKTTKREAKRLGREQRGDRLIQLGAACFKLKRRDYKGRKSRRFNPSSLYGSNIHQVSNKLHDP